MDIEEVMQLVPRRPEEWTAQDVQRWLRFVQLPQLVASFKANGIDGPRLLRITWNQLQRIPVPSNIIKKKVLAWASFLTDHLAFCHQYFSNPRIDRTATSKRESSKQSSFATTVEDFEETQSQVNSVLTREMFPKTESNERCPSLHQQLLIYEKMASGANRYIMCDRPELHFGRSPGNRFVVIERDIEPVHCSVVHHDGLHYIAAPMTSSGLWIQINGRLDIAQRCVLEMGETDFNIKVDGTELVVTFVRMGQLENFCFDGQALETVRIGRRNNCDIIIPFDTTLSGYHGKFIFQGRWYFQDLETTNGTWSRVLDRQPITEGMLIRLGRSTTTYQCRLQYSEDTRSTSSVSEPGSCRKCKTNEKNCYFRPCYHNQFCYECGRQMERCGVCLAAVRSVERIYKL